MSLTVRLLNTYTRRKLFENEQLEICAINARRSKNKADRLESIAFTRMNLIFLKFHILMSLFKNIVVVIVLARYCRLHRHNE